METRFIENLKSKWYPMRLIALIAGTFFALHSMWYWDGLTALIGGFFLFQAVTNNGCLGARNCSVPPASDSSGEEGSVREITYSEIKE